MLWFGGCVFDYILNELRSATLPLFWNSNIDSDFLNGMPCILFIHWYDTGAANHLKFLTWSRKVQNLISQWNFFFIVYRVAQNYWLYRVCWFQLNGTPAQCTGKVSNKLFEMFQDHRLTQRTGLQFQLKKVQYRVRKRCLNEW